MFKLKKITNFLILISFLSANLLFVEEVFSASVTTFSDTLSTLTQSVDANHEILFITPTGVEANNDTIILTFAGFDGTSLNAVDFGDVDLAESANASCSAPGSWTDKTLGSADGASTYGVATTTTQMLFDPPTTSGYITAGRCIRIKIGTNATGGVNQITNGSAASAHTITLSGNFGDSGTTSIDIISDDSVNVTANVDPTITFTISDTTVGFGTLSNGTASWATGDLAGVTSVPADSSGAHEMSIGTNAASGYTITYNGATLTNGGNTINVATIAADNDGTPGTEQFAIGIDDNGGNVSIVSDYDLAGTNSYKFVAGTTTAVASETIATATETIDVQYIANIASTTEAGSYSTDITWIATGNF